jgi:nucleotide-binding universal stress UspA family protein
MHAYLWELAGRLATDGAHVTPQCRDAPLSAAALREVASDSKLVVMAQRPRRFAGWFSPDNRVERLLKFGSSPLVLVRGYRWPYSKRQAQRPKHVLAVLDGTLEAERVLPAAAAIATSAEGRLTLLRIAPGIPYYGIPSAEKEAEAEAYLAKVVEAFGQRGLQAEAAVWSSNESLGEVMLSFAQSRQADLIALTTSLRRTVVGSLRRRPVRYLLRNSRIPLLLVNADSTRSPGG